MLNPYTSLIILASLACLLMPKPVWAARMDGFPAIILWAWERAEDLRFLPSERFGVAFLAQTLRLQEDTLLVNPRRQALKVSPTTRLIAVTRIETHKKSHQRAALSAAQREAIIQRVLQTAALKNISAVQIDFDAKVSEREFYRQFLITLRSRLAADIALSITALASFCLGDGWINGLPVDEAVPMIFRMGIDAKKVQHFLAEGNDFSVPLCQQSYGIATDEAEPPQHFVKLRQRRLYVFKGRHDGWKLSDLDFLIHR
ncbi:hypothetical protein CEK71_08040 [Methylovulum psychrotolerans]|uniref:DUF3142 domain-containing protein n=2 Tax=Methylovulum psychrotolerans TaxID=1704499 RepID=A0A1Z4BXK8_9GAMM|nr:hypothetical protein CEK71_08040 [Methylovulum psychrotolerans]